jgi:hypothetical protein
MPFCYRLLILTFPIFDSQHRLNLPQNKKKRPSRRAPAEPEIPATNGHSDMEVDEKPIVPRARDLDTNFVDDDELQAALARSRRAKIHKQKKLSPEEIARKGAHFFFLLYGTIELIFYINSRGRTGSRRGCPLR